MAQGLEIGNNEFLLFFNVGQGCDATQADSEDSPNREPLSKD